MTAQPLKSSFLAIIRFPLIKPGKDAEFREWFAWSNKEYAKHTGFISRKLLKSREGGNYAAVVEHESYETFWAMHTSLTQAEAGKRIKSLLVGKPTPQFYDAIAG